MNQTNRMIIWKIGFILWIGLLSCVSALAQSASGPIPLAQTASPLTVLSATMQVRENTPAAVGHVTVIANVRYMNKCLVIPTQSIFKVLYQNSPNDPRLNILLVGNVPSKKCLDEFVPVFASYVVYDQDVNVTPVFLVNGLQPTRVGTNP